MKILIGGAWPYANGSLHIGHLAALLPGDILARYHRAKGDEVYYVSGSDCHGTPVAIRAKQENRTPQEISNFYHAEFCDCFQKLGFSYDYYGKTSTDQHKAFVTDFHKALYSSSYIEERITPQAYCPSCKTFLTDRFVVGQCPTCSKKARGDQCDACGSVLEPETLMEPTCSICGGAIDFVETRHLFITISRIEESLENFVLAHPHWRKNAIGFTNRYIREGLRDRAVTRYLDWGIDVPKAGYEDKKIYIWAENVLGYLSASKKVCEERGSDFEELWGDNSRHYYVHGKDNIPFHSIILPALLLAHGGHWHLPDEIVSSEYLTLEGRKISTSENWAVWVKDIVDRYDPDSLRYAFLANGPEKRDTDFTWREYIALHNKELLGGYGNFVNRTLAFITRYCDGVIPQGSLSSDIRQRVDNLFLDVGQKIEHTLFRDALETIFEFVRFGNQYFDAEKPWDTRTNNPSACENTLFNCVQIIANLSVLLAPFLPFSSVKVQRWLGLTDLWQPQFVPFGIKICPPEILFQRIDPKTADAELEGLSSPGQ